jgi:Tol biopolymer transport system component
MPRKLLLILCFLLTIGLLPADEPQAVRPLIGYTELQTNLPGGRHDNVRTMRATVVRADGSERARIAEELADEPDTWTQFAGWSPDGMQAIVSRGWQDPENAKWEDEHKTFRMEPGKWSLDSCLVDIATGKVSNLTAVERVSHYNGGLFFYPDGKSLGFTPLINGISKPFVMDLDGRNKRDLSASDAGFSYGYSASPDGKHISYHENYQIYIANADGSKKRHINTGHPFDFAPRWSPDGQWLLFVSGEHYNCHPHIVRSDGTGLKKLADRAGYLGVTEFLDVFDFHGGSSDVPVWSMDGQTIFYTAQVANNGDTASRVELFRITLSGEITQLTNTSPGTTHYHPTPSPDGQQLLYGSKRDGIRQLFVMKLADRSETQITSLKPGFGAMWPHWQLVSQVEAVTDNKLETQKRRRVLYNFDGDSCLSTKANSKGPVAVSVDDVKKLIEEVAYVDSRVDTVLVCINAQVMYYPTKVGTMRGTLSTPEERANWPASEKQRFENLKAFFDSGVDPYAVMLSEARRNGLEALLTFRMNDDHGNDFLRTQFKVDHSDWRLGTVEYQGRDAMDFGRDEVRDYTFRLIEEAIRRYDCDGIELDFNRFPNFFKDGTTDERVAKMNSLVERVRKMLDEVGQERGRKLLLSVRPPSNYGRTPPTPETSRNLGCDVPAWAMNGWIDFVAVSEFLFERGDLPIDDWKKVVTTIPVYGGIECTRGGGNKNLTAEEYRAAAENLIRSNADGVYLFNFFTSREGGADAYEPPFEVLKDLGR